jgi:hypothetical protein
VAFRGLFLTADLATRIARVGHRAGDASDADATVAARQESYALGPMDWSAVDASGTPAQTLSRAMDAAISRHCPGAGRRPASGGGNSGLPSF